MMTVVVVKQKKGRNGKSKTRKQHLLKVRKTDRATSSTLTNHLESFAVSKETGQAQNGAAAHCEVENRRLPLHKHTAPPLRSVEFNIG